MAKQKKKSDCDLYNENIIQNAVYYTAWIYVDKQVVRRDFKQLGMAGAGALMLEDLAKNGKEASVYAVNKDKRFALIDRKTWLPEAEKTILEIKAKNLPKK